MCNLVFGFFTRAFERCGRFGAGGCGDRFLGARASAVCAKCQMGWAQVASGRTGVYEFILFNTDTLDVLMSHIQRVGCIAHHNTPQLPPPSLSLSLRDKIKMSYATQHDPKPSPWPPFRALQCGRGCVVIYQRGHSQPPSKATFVAFQRTSSFSSSRRFPSRWGTSGGQSVVAFRADDASRM